MRELLSLSTKHQAKVLFTIEKAQHYIQRNSLQINDEEAMMTEIVEEILKDIKGAPMFTKIVQRHTI